MAKAVTIHQMVREYLVEHGYDGLYQPGECACLLADLMPCEHEAGSCEAGYRKECDCGEHTFHVDGKK